MPETLPAPHELRQHAVVQAISSAYTTLLQSYPHLAQHTFWLACSGGRDSLSLALACHILKLPIRIIHINHNLQAAATAWEALVRDYAQQWQLPFYSHTLHLTDTSEVHARNARFQAIYRHMHHGDVVMLGHHADDQAETLLMNLCQGAGLNGLSGMSAVSQRQVACVHPTTCNTDASLHDNAVATHAHHTTSQPETKTLTLWRPWLNVSRAQITDFAHRNTLNFVDDPTNADTHDEANTRAFLRAHVFPQLKKRWPKVTQNMTRAATLVTEAHSTIMAQTQHDLELVMHRTATTADQSQEDTAITSELSVASLLSLPYARQMQVLMTWMQGDAVYAPPRLQVEHVQRMATQYCSDQKTCIAWHDIQIRRFKNTLYRLPQSIPIAKQQHVQLTMHDRIELPSGSWRVVPCSNGTGLPHTLFNQSLNLRPKQAGERLHIQGRVGSWPLKKFFQAQQVAPWQRDQAHILQYNRTDVALVCHAGFFMLQHTTNDTTLCTDGAHASAEPADACQFWQLQPCR